MKRVVCLNNGYCDRATSDSVNLIEGKVYLCDNYDSTSFEIRNEKGEKHWYHKNRFVTLENLRDKKIDFLLNSENI